MTEPYASHDASEIELSNHCSHYKILGKIHTICPCSRFTVRGQYVSNMVQVMMRFTVRRSILVKYGAGDDEVHR